MTVGSLAEELGRAGVIGAGKVYRAVEVVAEIFSDEDYTVFLSLSGPIVPAGLRFIISDLLKKRFIDAVVTSGANIVHDLIEAIGGRHLSGSPDADDERLKERGISRVYDIYMEFTLFQDLEHFLFQILDSIPQERRIEIPITGLLREIGLRLRDEDSILRCAALREIPIFCPALLDSMVGIPIWMYSKRGTLRLNPLKDFELFSQLVYDAKKAGAIILGGGVPKHHTLYMNTLRGGLDAAVQITTARAEDGSLSGAPLREAISWGKIKGARIVDVYGDATILFPLIVAAALERIEATFT